MERKHSSVEWLPGLSSSEVKTETPKLVSHAVGLESKRKVAENEAWYHLLKMRYRGLPGATGVLAKISGLLSPKTCPCAPTINSRNLLLTKTNQATIRQNCVFSPFIYIQKWKIRPRSKDMGFGAKRKKKKFTSYGTMFLTDFIELYSTETHSKALNSIHMIYLSTMSNSMPLSRGLRLVYA